MNQQRSSVPKEVVQLGSKFYGNMISGFAGGLKSEDNFQCSHRASKNSQNKDLRVYGISSDNSACGHYRIKYPLSVLAKQGANVKMDYVPSLDCLDLNKVSSSNYIILSRTTDIDMFKAIREVADRNGAIVVYDLDDCFSEIDKESPAFRYYDVKTKIGKYNIDGSKYAMRNSDSVIFSTRELEAYYRDICRDTHIISNGIDPSLGLRDWTVSNKDDWKRLAMNQNCDVYQDSLLVGWSGSITHISDLKPYGQAIKDVLSKNKNVIFGMYCDEELAMHMAVCEWKLPMERFLFIPPQSFQNYPQRLSWFDIGLAPLINTTFNRCKSNLKLLEMGAQAVPYVASKVAPYQRFHVETLGSCGMIASDCDEFGDSIDHLVNNPDTRNSMRMSAIMTTRSGYDVQNTAESYGYTLRLIKENKYSITKHPSVFETVDLVQGKPVLQKEIRESDFCPCGSGYTYECCSNMCYPAFG